MARVLPATLTIYQLPSHLAWTTSGELIVMVALGGIGTLFGPVANALAFLLLERPLASPCLRSHAFPCCPLFSSASRWPTLFGKSSDDLILLADARGGCRLHCGQCQPGATAVSRMMASGVRYRSAISRSSSVRSCACM